MRCYVPTLIRRNPVSDCTYLSDRFIQALPAMYVAWVIPLLFTLVLLVPPWQHPDENAHFLRIAQIADGALLGYRIESGAGGRVDPAIVAALLPFNAVPFHPDRKVTAAMYAAAHRFHWSMVRRDLDFRNTAFYPPFLYAPSVLAVWVGRALDLTIIQTLYLARGANAIVPTFLTFLALVFARRTRIGLSVVAILPMTITLYTSASQDALIISLVILAVGAIDRIIDSDRAA